MIVDRGPTTGARFSLSKRLKPRIISVAFSQPRRNKRNQRQLIWQGDGNDETTDWTFVPHNDG